MQLTEEPAGQSESMVRETAYRFGPWLLGASSETNHGYFNELEASNVMFSAHVLPAANDTDSPFRVPMAVVSAAYRPAEYPEQPSDVVLRPIAEQTAMRSARWQMDFVAKSDS